jgi:hypothetical protein
MRAGRADRVQPIIQARDQHRIVADATAQHAFGRHARERNALREVRARRQLIGMRHGASSETEIFPDGCFGARDVPWSPSACWGISNASRGAAS